MEVLMVSPLTSIYWALHKRTINKSYAFLKDLPTYKSTALNEYLYVFCVNTSHDRQVRIFWCTKWRRTKTDNPQFQVVQTKYHENRNRS
jgi:hypothetical protein